MGCLYMCVQQKVHSLPRESKNLQDLVFWSVTEMVLLVKLVICSPTLWLPEILASYPNKERVVRTDLSFKLFIFIYISDVEQY